MIELQNNIHLKLFVRAENPRNISNRIQRKEKKTRKIKSNQNQFKDKIAKSFVNTEIQGAEKSNHKTRSIASFASSPIFFLSNTKLKNSFGNTTSSVMQTRKGFLKDSWNTWDKQPLCR